MPITTIICRNCNKLLRKGDVGANKEFKICPQCVIATHKASDTIMGVPKDKILNMPPTTQDGRTRFAVEEELRRLKKRISKLNIEIPYVKLNQKGDYVALFQLKDAFNQPFAELGFSSAKLKEIANDLDKLNENKVDE